MKEKTKKKFNLGSWIVNRLKTNVAMTVLMSLLAAYSLGCAVYFAAIGNVRDVFVSLAYFCIVPIVYLGEASLKVKIPLAYTVLLLVFVVFCHLGACFNFYTLIPFLDDVLHAAFGIVFAVVGYAVIISALGKPQTTKSFITYLVFAVGFGVIISVVWEIYEYVGDLILPDMDMQEDTIVNHIHSFLLFPGYDHLHTEQIEGIAYTVLYNAAGEEIYRIQGGYLDIGLIDTMNDLIWASAFLLGFFGVMVADWFCGKRLNRWFLPELCKPAKTVEEQPAEEGESEANGVEATEEEAEIEENSEGGQS